MWTMQLVLVWAVCVLIVGVGFCGKQLTKLTLKEKEVNLAGNVFFGIWNYVLACRLDHLPLHDCHGHQQPAMKPLTN